MDRQMREPKKADPLHGANGRRSLNKLLILRYIQNKTEKTSERRRSSAGFTLKESRRAVDEGIGLKVT
jgi:hypothetical protein